jgi:hypothetical protein
LLGPPMRAFRQHHRDRRGSCARAHASPRMSRATNNPPHA